MAELVTKLYFCNVCRAQHAIQLPADFAKGRESYPFSHVFLHKVEKCANIEDIGTDVLTTLYIDANNSIRGVEVKKLVGGDIISKDESKEMIVKLMNEIGNLQCEILQLQQINNELREKYNRLLSQGSP